MKRKLRFNIWLGVALGVIGLYLLSVPSGAFTIGKGEIIAIGGAFAFAGHILVIDYFCTKVDNITLYKNKRICADCLAELKGI